METLNEKFLQVCRDFSDQEVMKVKVPDGWEKFSYAALSQGALAVAGWLQATGFQKQSKAAIILDNHPHWSMVYFGILLAGGVAVPLDPQSSPKDISVFLKDSQAEVVFLEDRLKDDIVDATASAIQWVILHGSSHSHRCFSFDEILSAGKGINPAHLPPVGKDDTASMIYTSGTTSQPKGVELSQKTIFSNFHQFSQLNLISSEDCFVSILPLFHAYSFMATLIIPLFYGAKIIYPNTLKSTELLPIVQEVNVTIFVGVPELFYNIHRAIANRLKSLPFSKRILMRILTLLGKAIRKTTGINILRAIYKPVQRRFGSSLRFFISGGARLDPKIAKDFYAWGFEILEGYGLTETSPVVSLNPPGQAKFGCVGKVLPGVTVRIDNPNDQGVGEVVVRGDNVMKGYYQKRQATDEVIRDGWFFTGDLGRLDSKGYLFLSGRSKEVIVLRSGKNIFPDEIENYYTHTQFIKELAVFIPEGETQETLKAVIVPDFEAFKKSGDVNIDEKIRWDIENISKELPSYKRIHGFVFSKEDLPKTRLGKIKRYQLPGIYKRLSQREVPQKDDEQSKEENAILDSPVGNKVVAFLQKELDMERVIRPNDHLEIDLGIDSLTRVELIAGLEQMFQSRVTDKEMAEIGTVSDLIMKIENILAARQIDGQITAPVKIEWKDILRDKSSLVHGEQNVIYQSFGARFVSHLLRWIIFLIFKVFYQLKVYGKDKISPQGPYIICCNHSSYFDAFAVIAALSNHVCLQTHFIGTKDIFLHPSVRWTIKLVRLIPIDSSSELIKAMQMASFLIEQKKILCIFPEGQRSIDGKVKRFKKGIGILAKELDVKILPVAIHGTFEAWPRAVKYPGLHPVKVIFGDLADPKDILAQNPHPSDDDYQTIAQWAQDEVSRLHQQIASP